MGTLRYTEDQRAEAFWAKVEKTETCWLWTGYKDPSGYGRFKFEGDARLAHHFLVGRPPEGLQYDHVKARGCLNRHCVNPAHLELVTSRENTMRGDNQTAHNVKKTHCPRGHAYDDTNTYFSCYGYRQCRACHALAEKNRRARAS